MSKKYANNLRLNLPTGEDCLRANAELQRRLLSETEEYAHTRSGIEWVGELLAH